MSSLPEQTLYGFTQEVLVVLRGLFDTAYIPDDPVSDPGKFPFVTVYTASGITKAEPAGLVSTGLSNVTIAVIVPRDDVAKAVQFLLPYWDRIPIELAKAFIKDTVTRSKHAQHIGSEMNQTLGPIEWAQGVVRFGYLIDLVGVKIQNEVP